MTFPYERAALDIMSALHAAEKDLMGKWVRTPKFSGAVEHVSLDDLHGLRVQLFGIDDWIPVSMIVKEDA